MTLSQPLKRRIAFFGFKDLCYEIENLPRAPFAKPIAEIAGLEKARRGFLSGQIENSLGGRNGF